MFHYILFSTEPSVATIGFLHKVSYRTIRMNILNPLRSFMDCIAPLAAQIIGIDSSSQDFQYYLFMKKDIFER